MPDNERLLRAVEEPPATPGRTSSSPYPVLRDLSWVLRESEFHVKCVISHDGDGSRLMIRMCCPRTTPTPS